MDNGIPVLDEETEIFKDTSSIKPDNISGKLLGDTMMMQITLFGSDRSPINANLCSFVLRTVLVCQELSIFILAQNHFKNTKGAFREHVIFGDYHQVSVPIGKLMMRGFHNTPDF